MTATPDRPATTPEGAGLRAAWQEGWEAAKAVVDFEGVKVWAHTVFPDEANGNPYLSERTEGAGEVALSEERAVCTCGEYDFIHVEADHGRALPTAGRVVEVERVAEQVEALAGAIKREAGDDWTAHSEASNMGDLDAANLHGEAGEVRDDIAARLLALVAAIRADGSAER